jgi:hypothetical protein
VKSKHTQIKEIVKNEVQKEIADQLQEVNKRLDEEVAEIKVDVKRIRLDVNNLTLRANHKDRVDEATTAQTSDCFTNIEKMKTNILLFDCFVDNEDRSFVANKKRVLDYLHTNFPKLQEGEILIEKISYLNKRKNNILKVKFANEELKEKILTSAFEQNLEGIVIFEFVTIETRIRRKILNVLAAKFIQISRNALRIEVPRAGPIPVLIVENPLENIREELPFVDALVKYAHLLDPVKDLAEISEEIAALDQGQKMFNKFLVF